MALNYLLSFNLFLARNIQKDRRPTQKRAMPFVKIAWLKTQ